MWRCDWSDVISHHSTLSLWSDICCWMKTHNFHDLISFWWERAIISNCSPCLVCCRISAMYSAHKHLFLWLWNRSIKETRCLILFMNAASSQLSMLSGTRIASSRSFVARKRRRRGGGFDRTLPLCFAVVSSTLACAIDSHVKPKTATGLDLGSTVS